MSKLAFVFSLIACGLLIMFQIGCSKSDTGNVENDSQAPQAEAFHDGTASESADKQLADREEIDDPNQTTNSPAHDSLQAAEYVFEKPVRIKGGGEYVSVESPGYACPTMADVDGDGREDLVVGQFNRGNLKFFKNIAEQNRPPKFAEGEWLMTGDERATVPGVW